jgi:hypothetical protein
MEVLVHLMCDCGLPRVTEEAAIPKTQTNAGEPPGAASRYH